MTSEALQKLMDESLELEIQMAGKNIEIAHLQMKLGTEPYMYFAGQRDYWAGVLRDCVAMRSAEQVLRMEQALGLAS